jgi:putative membrane protein
MFQLIIQWLLSSIAMMILSQTLPGYYLQGSWPAMLAAVSIGFVNAILGIMLRLITSAAAILAIGLFIALANGAMIMMASRYLDGFYVSDIPSALWSGMILGLISVIFRFVTRES